MSNVSWFDGAARKALSGLSVLAIIAVSYAPLAAPLASATPVSPTTVTVRPSSLNGWSSSVASGATTDFVTVTGAPIGTGALELKTTSDDNSVAHMSETLNMPLADLSDLSFQTDQLSAQDVTNGNATLRISIDTDNDGVADDQLMYEPYFNGFDGTTMTGWKTWTITPSSGKFWSNNNLPYNGLGGAAVGYGTNFTIADVLHDYPNAKIVGLTASMGTYNVSQDVLFDDLRVVGAGSDTTYNFESDPLAGPVVSVTPVAGSIVHGQQQFNITLTDPDGLDASKNGAVWVYLYNGAPPQASSGAKVNLSSGTGTFAADTTKLVDGDADLNVGAVYDANDTVTASTYFKHYIVDNTGPTVSVTPVAGSNLSGTVDFTITVTDANPLDPTKNKSIWVYLYNTTDQTKKYGQKVDLSSGTGTFSVDTTQLPDGNYDLDVGVVTDAAGNPTADQNHPTGTDSYFKNYTINNTLPAPTGLTAKFQYDSTNVANGSTLNVTSKSGGNNLELQWDTPTATVTGYQVLDTYPDGTTNIGYGGSNTNAWLVPNGFGAHGNGEYDYQVVAVNGSKTSLPSDTFKLYYDTQSPTAQFNPVPPMYVNGNFAVSGTASDNVALQSVFFDVRDPSITSGNSWVAGCVATSTVITYSAASTTANAACTINTSNLTEGKTYTLRIHAGDNAGYGGGEQQDLVVDRTRPNATITTPVNSSTQTGSFTITGTATDNLSGIDHVQVWVSKLLQPGNTFGGYAVDNQTATWDAGTGTFSYDVSGLADGTYIVKADAFDKAGNDHFASPAPTITVVNTVNPTMPSVPTLLSPDNSSTINTNDFYFTWNPSTGGTGPITYDFQSSMNPAQTGGVLTTGVWDSIANGQTLTSPTIHSTGAPDGTWYWQVRAIDGNNDLSDWSDIWNTTIDTAPVVLPSVTTNDATNISGLDATLNATDGAIDADGGESFWVSTTPGIDTSSPNIPADVYSTPVLPAVTANTSFSDALSLITTNGIVTGGQPGNMPAITSGMTYYYVAWVNVGGTWYHGAEKSVTTTADGTTPVVTLNGNSPIYLKLNANYHDQGVTITDSPTNNLGYTIATDGAATTSSASFSLNTSVEGTHTLTYSATDGGGNVGTTSRIVIVDGTAPTVTLSSNSANPTSDNPIHVTATFSEPVSGFDETDLSVTNAAVSNFTASSTNDLVYTFDLTPSGSSVDAAINAGSFTDLAGNDNAVGADFTRTITSSQNNGGNGGPVDNRDDINHDGKVNFIDFVLLVGAMGPHGSNLPAADLNGDHKVDALDLIIFLANWH